jgi:hypothetical protein
VECSIASKLCNNQQNCSHSNCKKNYPSEETISSAENKLTMQNINKINSSQILNVSSITSDASCQIKKTSKTLGIRFYTCLVHRMRNVQKKFQHVKIQSYKKIGHVDKSTFMRLLANSVRKRAYREILRHHRNTLNEDNFVEKTYEAIQNIVPCFSGEHRRCRRNSLVCAAHLKSYQTKFLPSGRHLRLVDCDKACIAKSLEKTLSRQQLTNMSRLNNTNKAESLHHRVMTYTTKQVTWIRNYFGMCHSAVHSSSFGTGQSTVLLATALGLTYNVNGPMATFLNATDHRAEYECKRQKQLDIKQRRYRAKMYQSNRNLRQCSLYRQSTSSGSDEHNYGINVTT